MGTRWSCNGKGSKADGSQLQTWLQPSLCRVRWASWHRADFCRCFPSKDQGSSSLGCRVAQAPSALLCGAELPTAYHVLHRALDEDIERQQALPFPFQLDSSSFPRGFLLLREDKRFLPETSPLTAPWKTLLSLERLGGFKRRKKEFSFVLAGFKLCGTMMVS